MEKLKVFSGSAHPELARAICAQLGVPLGAAKLVRFTNENLKVKIEENRFGFEPEITAKIAHMDARIYEVAISYYGRTYAEGKKIGWKDGVSALRCILKYNLFR